MKALRELVRVNLLLYRREPAAFFFSMIFPVMLLLLFGLMFGGESTIDESFAYVEEAVPGFIIVIVATVGLLQIPVNLALRKEMRILRGLKLTPLKPGVYIFADIIANMTIVLASMLLLSFVGWLAFGMRFAGQIPLALAGMLLCCATFFAFGYLIANLSPTSKAASAIGNLVFFPFMFLSGAAIPLSAMPEHIQTFTAYLPMTQAVSFMQGLWMGRPLEQLMTPVVSLGVLAIVSAAIAARFFKWE